MVTHLEAALDEPVVSFGGGGEEAVTVAPGDYTGDVTAEEMVWAVTGGIFLLMVALFPYFMLWNAEDCSSPSLARGLGGFGVILQVVWFVDVGLGAPWGEDFSGYLIVLGMVIFFAGLGGSLES